LTKLGNPCVDPPSCRVYINDATPSYGESNRFNLQ